MGHVLASIRLVVATMLVCVVGYVLVVLGVAQLLFTDTAQGSLITAPDGQVIGSRLIGQAFTEPRYLWPRPSNAGDGYNATAAAGSNKSPTSPDLTARAEELVARYGATSERPLPADLAAASGSGLDPHISLGGALFQAPRVAEARGLEPGALEALIEERAYSPGGFLTDSRIVNVLEINLALDAMEQ